MESLEKVIRELPVEHQEYLKRYFKNAPDWLLESLRVVNVPANTSFIEEGEEVDSIYFLIKGKVSAMEERVLDVVYKHYEFYPVEVFGAMELIGEIDYYMTTLTAVEDCVFLKTSCKKYDKWLSEDSNVFRIQAAQIERYLLKQARKERLNVLLGGTERVALMLCHSYELLAENTTKTVAVGRKEFVEKTGLSERSVTRILKDFEAKQLISRKGWDVVVTFEQYLKVKELLDDRVYVSE